jgi:hypothetical protein
VNASSCTRPARRSAVGQATSEATPVRWGRCRGTGPGLGTRPARARAPRRPRRSASFAVSLLQTPQPLLRSCEPPCEALGIGDPSVPGSAPAPPGSRTKCEPRWDERVSHRELGGNPDSGRDWFGCTVTASTVRWRAARRSSPGGGRRSSCATSSMAAAPSTRSRPGRRGYRAPCSLAGFASSHAPASSRSGRSPKAADRSTNPPSRAARSRPSYRTRRLG